MPLLLLTSLESDIIENCSSRKVELSMEVKLGWRVELLART